MTWINPYPIYRNPDFGPWDGGSNFPWYDLCPFSPSKKDMEERAKKFEEILKGAGQTDRKSDSRIEDLERRVKALENELDGAKKALMEIAEKKKAETPSLGIPAEIDDEPTQPSYCCSGHMLQGEHYFTCPKLGIKLGRY